MPSLKSIFLAKLSIFFLLFLQSIHCQANVPQLLVADSLFQQRSYKEAMEIYQLNYQLGIYSPSMLLKMAFISEGIGDNENATLYLSKYYDLSPNPQTITKIKSLTGQNELIGYEVSDGMRFVLFLVEYKEIIVAALTLVLIMSLIFLWSKGKKLTEARFYWPSVILITLIFATNNFLQAPNAALVTKSPTLIVSEPSAGGELVDLVEPGHRVKIKASKDIWYEVEWKEKIAYIRKDNVTRL
ncbi:SH3 domain-containing protein [Algoriphagus lacus]|uniref:SH3 domain-containing protein n=1 Tax=Algoriphagus lacus TaxID=2056311 RepID=A0A418PU00_9BACT|nr:SH3 domain-containing protein [Algoriphagus lacus]